MTGLRLSPRQTRTALDLLTGAVVISVAVALAGLTWRIAGHAGTGAIVVPGRHNGATAAPDMAPVIALAPFGKSVQTDAPQPTALPLELKGVVAAVPPTLSTAFIAVGGQPAKPFHVGDAVNGATVQSVQHDRVLLLNGGRSEFLAFPDPRLTPEQRQAAAAQPNAGPMVPGPAPRPAALPGNTAAVLEKIGAVQTGDGLRIGNGGPPGMQPGDLITTVNGVPTTDSQAANAAFAAAQQSGTVQLQILRNGKPMTLTVPLR